MIDLVYHPGRGSMREIRMLRQSYPAYSEVGVVGPPATTRVVVCATSAPARD